MLTIYKYPLPRVTDEFTIVMPEGAEILSVQMQREQACIWALVNPTEDTTVRVFRLRGTGHPVDFSLTDYPHIGTFQCAEGSLVFHLFG